MGKLGLSDVWQFMEISKDNQAWGSENVGEGRKTQEAQIRLGQ